MPEGSEPWLLPQVRSGPSVFPSNMEEKEMEKTAEELIKFTKVWRSENGTNENLERLLHGLVHENRLYVDLIPEEIFHELCGSNVLPIPMDDVPKYQGAYPDYDWNALAARGEEAINV